MSETRASSPMRSLERAIDVLEVLEAARTPLRLSEVARRAGLHVATTQRILAVLEARDRVELGPAGYRTGVAMLFGAHAYLANDPVAAGSPPVLQELAAATGLTASVFVRAGDHRAVVARVEGRNPLRYVLPVGQRLSLHLGAGKALAAYLPEAELHDFLERTGQVTRADGQQLDGEAFAAELAEVRRTGWVHSVDERVVGAASVAAPIVAPDGSCSIAVQVSGPSHDDAFSRLDVLSVEVRQAAAALAARLG